MDKVNNDIHYYINRNTWAITTDLKNTYVPPEIENDPYFSGGHLEPIEDRWQTLSQRVPLASTSYVDKGSNSVNLANGATIKINDGRWLKLTPYGVKVLNDKNPYCSEAPLKAHSLAGALNFLIRNAAGICHQIGYSNEEIDQYHKNVAELLKFIGLDSNRNFCLNGMKYVRNSNGEFESQATINDRIAREKLEANNRSYRLADTTTRKEIYFKTGYYLKKAPQEMKDAWQETLDETGINPFQHGTQSTLTTLSVEQDIATRGNDDIFGTSVESCIEGIDKIIERTDNPTYRPSERDIEFFKEEKQFYTTLKNKLSKYLKA